MKVVLFLSAIFTCLTCAIFGCTTTPHTPPSPFAQAVLGRDSQKATIVLYRSTEESFWFKNGIAKIYIDGTPFVYLDEGEYLPVYLTEGEHSIEASYSHSATLDFDKPAKATLNLKSEDVFYVLIVPEWEGIGFFSYFFLPIPVPGAAAEIHITSEEKARKWMGKLLEGELLKNRLLDEK